MSATIVVTGVPGVGASRVCEEARRTLGDAVTLVNVGDVMLEEALEHDLARGRDAIAELPLRDQRILQRRAGEFLAREAEEGPLLVNTHLVVHTAHGFVPGLPEAVRADLHPNAFVVVDAAAGTIQERRAGTDRDYPTESAAGIEFHRNLQNAAALAYSTETGAPIRYVSSEPGPEAAGEELASMVEAAIRE